MNQQAPQIPVAGSLRKRPGFKLCRQCGKVQSNHFRNDGQEQEKPQDHAIDCSQRDSNDDGGLVSLHLYREFSSEALRILVPYTRTGVDEQIVQSFIAALQLGFKLQFGGKVDHLRFIEQNVPAKNGEERRHYILIYDSVPGGTGYLHQSLVNKLKR